METTITEFQRRFSEARAAADRGETVLVQTGKTDYVFLRRPRGGNPFADLSHLCGVVSLPRVKGSGREKIRRRLRKVAAR